MKRFVILVCILQMAAPLLAAGKASLDVRDFGATGNGVVKDTVAFQKALDACASAGGGTVTVPDGIYLIGSLVIGPNTTLDLAGRASLLGSSDLADYPLMNIRWEGEFREGHRALIVATNVANVAITGSGTIFGPPISLSHLRNPRGPVLVELTDCTNATLDGFTTQYQQLWSIHVLFCCGLNIRNLTIRTVNGNGDGIDLDSCAGVTIDHCDINTGDDAISLKSGRGLAAQKLGRPTEDVVIRDCRLQSSIFAAIGFGTEMSGGIRNIKIQNCVLSGRQNAIFIKSRDGRGGYMENISGENLTVLKSPTFIGIDLLKKGIQASDPVPGAVEKWARVRDLAFTNIHVQDVGELVAATNIPKEQPLDGFKLADISGTCARAISLANMTNVDFSRITVTGFSGPLISTENVKGTGLKLSASK